MITEDKLKTFKSRYILRSCAGSHWLIDVAQPGLPYIQPLCLNQIGADICRLILEGNSLSVIIDSLAREYETSPREIEGDVTAFIENLCRKAGI